MEQTKADLLLKLFLKNFSNIKFVCRIGTNKGTSELFNKDDIMLVNSLGNDYLLYYTPERELYLHFNDVKSAVYKDNLLTIFHNEIYADFFYFNNNLNL